MEKGLELYKSFIDYLVELSRSCVHANNFEKGHFKGVENEDINAVLEKITLEDRQIISKYILESYSSGIFDVLDYLEWLQCCKGMKISIEDENLPSGEFEGFSNDYIGRRSDEWEWPR